MVRSTNHDEDPDYAIFSFLGSDIVLSVLFQTPDCGCCSRRVKDQVSTLMYRNRILMLACFIIHVIAQDGGT
jgi:hypothetical protein